jgi:hypothetical protein
VEREIGEMSCGLWWPRREYLKIVLVNDSFYSVSREMHTPPPNTLYLISLEQPRAFSEPFTNVRTESLAYKLLESPKLATHKPVSIFT